MFEPVSITREIIGNGASLLLQGDGTGVLPPEVAAFEGKVQCVYVDPPFMTGGTFTRRRRFGQKGWKTGSPAPEYPAYDDRFASRQDNSKSKIFIFSSILSLRTDLANTTILR